MLELKPLYEESTNQNTSEDMSRYGDSVRKEAMKLLKNIRFVMKSGVLNNAFTMPTPPKNMDFLLKDANMPKQFTNGDTDEEGKRPMYREPKQVVDETNDIADALFGKYNMDNFYKYLNENRNVFIEDLVYGMMLNEEFGLDTNNQNLETLIRDYIQASGQAVCTMIARVTGSSNKELLDLINDWARYTDPDIEQYVEQQRRRDINTGKSAESRLENVSAYYNNMNYLSYLRILVGTASNQDTNLNGISKPTGFSLDQFSTRVKNSGVEKLLEEFRQGKLTSTKPIRSILEAIHNEMWKVDGVGGAIADEGKLANALGIKYMNLPPESTYLKEEDSDNSIDADAIFNDVKTSLTKGLNSALSSDPGTWPVSKFFETSGEELIKAASEEIQTRIKVICNVDGQKKLRQKVPLQQAGLINLWKRYEQELYRRRHDRINQFGTSPSVKFFTEFMGVTVPNVLSAMIVFRNIVYALKHAVKPESLKQLEDILSTTSELDRKAKLAVMGSGEYKPEDVGLPIKYQPAKVSDWTTQFGVAVKLFNNFFKAHNAESQMEIGKKMADVFNNMWKALDKVARLPEGIQLPVWGGNGQQTPPPPPVNESLITESDDDEAENWLEDVFMNDDNESSQNNQTGQIQSTSSQTTPVSDDEPNEDFLNDDENQNTQEKSEENEDKKQDPRPINYMFAYLTGWKQIIEGQIKNNQSDNSTNQNTPQNHNQQSGEPQTEEPQTVEESLLYEIQSLIYENYINIEDDDEDMESLVERYSALLEDDSNNTQSNQNNTGAQNNQNNGQTPPAPNNQQGGQNNNQTPPPPPQTNQNQQNQTPPPPPQQQQQKLEKPFNQNSPEYIALNEMYHVVKKKVEQLQQRDESGESTGKDELQKKGNTGSAEHQYESVIYYYKGRRIHLHA